MRVDPHSSKAYVFLMTVEAVWLVVAGLGVCGGCVALVPHPECGIILCTAAVFLLRPAVGFRWPLGVKHSGVTQLCLNMFTTADHEPLLGLLHCSEALAWLPVAGAGQEVDEEADGKSAMRIWKTVLFLSLLSVMHFEHSELLIVHAGVLSAVCNILSLSALNVVFLIRLFSVVAMKRLESFQLCCVDNKSPTSQCVDLTWYLFSSVKFNTGFCSHVWHSSHGVQSCLCTFSPFRFD